MPKRKPIKAPERPVPKVKIVPIARGMANRIYGLLMHEDIEPVQLQVTRSHLRKYLRGWHPKLKDEVLSEYCHQAIEALIAEGAFMAVDDVEGEPGVQLSSKWRKIAYSRGKAERLRLGFPS